MDRVSGFRKHIFSSKIVYCDLPELSLDASTPSESAVVPKSNRIKFGSAHEWSGVWKGPCSSWYGKGVTKIHHLLNKRGTFLLRPDFQRKYGLSVNFLTCNGLLAAILINGQKSILNSEPLDNSEEHNCTS